MARVIVYLRGQERDALRTLAEREFRNPQAQAALIIYAELEKRGLLPADPVPADLSAHDPQPCEVTHGA